MSKRNTKLVRAPKKITEEWDRKFPDVSYSNLIQISYETSLLKMEGFLKRKRIR
jgi:hypothetical protein